MIYKYYIYDHRHKKSSLMSLQRIKNKGADQLANFSTLIVCYLDSIIPMILFLMLTMCYIQQAGLSL